MSEPETLQSLTEQLRALEARLPSLHSSVADGVRQALAIYALEVGRLEQRLAEFDAQQSAVIQALKELLPDFDRKLEEVNKAREKGLRDSVDQIAQNFAAQHGKKPDQR